MYHEYKDLSTTVPQQLEQIEKGKFRYVRDNGYEDYLEINEEGDLESVLDGYQYKEKDGYRTGKYYNKYFKKE